MAVAEGSSAFGRRLAMDRPPDGPPNQIVRDPFSASRRNFIGFLLGWCAAWACWLMGRRERVVAPVPVRGPSEPPRGEPVYHVSGLYAPPGERWWEGLPIEPFDPERFGRVPPPILFAHDPSKSIGQVTRIDSHGQSLEVWARFKDSEWCS